MQSDQNHHWAYFGWCVQSDQNHHWAHFGYCVQSDQNYHWAHFGCLRYKLLSCKEDWSDCANANVDLSLCLAHISEGTFSDVMAHIFIQKNLDSSNTDGSFTMPNSKSFLSPYKILPTAQENKYLGKFSHFITKLYVVCTH